MNPCANCQSQKFRYTEKIITTNPAYSDDCYLVQCAQCNLFMVNPPPDEEKLSEIYSGTYHYNPNPMQEKLVNAWAAMELSIDTNKVKQYKQKGAILDIGAGRGDFLLKFDASDWERWAFDPFLSQGDIDRLKEKIGNHVNDYKTLKEYPENTFDTVLLRNVIEHTADFNNLVTDIYRVLKPGGVLFIRTPNISSVDFEKLRTDWYVITMAGHIVFFSPETLKNVLQKAGFTAKHCQGLWYSAPLSLLRSDKSQQHISIKAIRSALMAVVPFFTRRGGDLQAIAQK